MIEFRKRKSKLFLRYLGIPLYFLVTPILVGLMSLLIGLIYNFILGLTFPALVILILLGIVSVSVGFWVLYIIGSSIYFVGRWVMRLCPNKEVFWVVLVLSVIRYISIIFGDRSSGVDYPYPLWADLLITSFVFILYSIGGYAQNEEDEREAMELERNHWEKVENSWERR